MASSPAWDLAGVVIAKTRNATPSWLPSIYSGSILRASKSQISFSHGSPFVGIRQYSRLPHHMNNGIITNKKNYHKGRTGKKSFTSLLSCKAAPMETTLQHAPKLKGKERHESRKIAR